MRARNALRESNFGRGVMVTVMLMALRGVMVTVRVMALRGVMVTVRVMALRLTVTFALC